MQQFKSVNPDEVAVQIVSSHEELYYLLSKNQQNGNLFWDR